MVSFFCRIEEFYRGDFRKTEKSKRSLDEAAPGFTHILHVFRLAFGGLEVMKHYSDLVPADAGSFWNKMRTLKALLSLAFRIGAHDIPEDEEKIQARTGDNNLLEQLQSFYVRCSARLSDKDFDVAWVQAENDALDQLDAKRPDPSSDERITYQAYIAELLSSDDVINIYVKMCDNLHNMTTRIRGNYDEEGVPHQKFVSKIRATEPLIEKALEVGFYWFMPLATLQRVFENNGAALLFHSPAWERIYTEIYLPRGGEEIKNLNIAEQP